MRTVLFSALTACLALLAQACLLDVPPPRGPLDDLWTRWMLAGHYGCWDEGKEVPCPDSGVLARKDRIHSDPEGAHLTKYGIHIFESRGFRAGWWLSGGLIGRVELSSVNIELFGKRIARNHAGIFSDGSVAGQDYTYEFFLVVRSQATSQGRLVRRWQFEPQELALTISPDNEAFARDIATRSKRDAESFIKLNQRHDVHGYLNFDPSTKTATITITGLTRPFQDRVDLSGVLGE